MQRSSRDKSRARASLTGSDVSIDVGLHGVGRWSGQQHKRDERDHHPAHQNHSAGCRRCLARAGFGAPTRRRRSDNDSTPPNAISTGPHQIIERQRLVMAIADGDRALGGDVTERDVELARAARQKRGLGGRGAARGKTALRRRH